MVMKTLTPKQRQAISLLASGESGKDVASAINCNPATISQWLNHDPQFRDALKVFSEESLLQAQVKLQSLSLSAIDELKELLVNAKSEQVRLKAIELILSSVGLNSGVKGDKGGQKNMEGLIATNAGQYDFNKLIESVTGG